MNYSTASLECCSWSRCSRAVLILFDRMYSFMSTHFSESVFHLDEISAPSPILFFIILDFFLHVDCAVKININTVDQAVGKAVGKSNLAIEKQTLPSHLRPTSVPLMSYSRPSTRETNILAREVLALRESRPRVRYQ